jgi:hypothetical protein
MNNFQENDILFIGSVHEERQDVEGFAVVTKSRGQRGFKIGKHPDDLLNGKKMYYCQAVEAMNAVWNDLFGEDVISVETIGELAVNDMYEH